MTEFFDRLVRVDEVAAMFGIAKKTVWKWAGNGKLPKGVKLSQRCTVWRLSDLVRARRAMMEA